MSRIVPGRIYLDASKIARELSCRQQVGLEEGLAQTVQFIKSAEQTYAIPLRPLRVHSGI